MPTSSRTPPSSTKLTGSGSAKVSLRDLLIRPAIAASVYSRLYRCAARAVPTPSDPKVVAYAHVDQDAVDETTFLSPHEAEIYDRWQAERDSVASRWFGKLLATYAHRTRYAPGYGPPTQRG